MPKSQIWQTCTNVMFQGYWNGDKLCKLVNLDSNLIKQNSWTWNLSTWTECPCSKSKFSNWAKSTIMWCWHVESYFKCSTSYKGSSNFLQPRKKTYPLLTTLAFFFGGCKKMHVDFPIIFFAMGFEIFLNCVCILLILHHIDLLFEGRECILISPYLSLQLALKSLCKIVFISCPFLITLTLFLKDEHVKFDFPIILFAIGFEIFVNCVHILPIT